jgi:hypothetical protein
MERRAGTVARNFRGVPVAARSRGRHRELVAPLQRCWPTFEPRRLDASRLSGHVFCNHGIGRHVACSWGPHGSGRADFPLDSLGSLAPAAAGEAPSRGDVCELAAVGAEVAVGAGVAAGVVPPHAATSTSPR